MLLVDFQAQVSGDVGLNDIPIKVATTMVRKVSTACRWGGGIHSSVCFYHFSILYEPILPSIIALLLQQDDIGFTEVVDDDGMLRVVQAQQVQVSGDGGLNNIPIKAATTTVRALPFACR